MTVPPSVEMVFTDHELDTVDVVVELVDSGVGMLVVGDPEPLVELVVERTVVVVRGVAVVDVEGSGIVVEVDVGRLSVASLVVDSEEEPAVSSGAATFSGDAGRSDT